MDPEESCIFAEGGSMFVDVEGLPSENPIYHRSLRSLSLLATRFVKMLQEAEGGVLDLREVSELHQAAVSALAVGKKRRIYDITNVLEGVGLIDKISKSHVKWRGSFPGDHSVSFDSRLIELKSELDELKQKEHTLDQQKFWVEQSIRNTTDDCSHLTYVNHDDICNCFSDQTLLTVRAPSGTLLDVPIPKADPNSPAKYQIYLKSISGPINIVLLNKYSESSAQLVLPVPPPETILQEAKSVMSTSEGSSIFNQASVNTEYSSKSKWPPLEDLRHLLTLSLLHSEPKKTSEFDLFSKGLENLFPSTKEKLKANIFTELMNPEALSPHVRLSPPPSERDYCNNLDESEGLNDLYDIPMLNV